ncbi:MAG TPA: hypothetical protein PKI93_02055 [Alphaproteobacteria bacterium]|nr:hypothetical protein [Alphaproteobacteria bacterium]
MSRDTMVPFASAEAAWFWFVQSQMARAEGAKIVAGAGLYPRPCEPVDICREVERLYRGRRLVIDHIKVMRHYGMRMMSPDPRRPKEARAHHVWVGAMKRLEDALVLKGIVDSSLSWRANCV